MQRCSPSPLASTLADQLDTQGFAVLPDVVGDIHGLADAYDRAVATAAATDVKAGRTSLRVSDFVNRGPAFDGLYTVPAVLDAASRIIRQPFKLSSFQARTLTPGADGHELHVDVPWQSPDWPLLAFIVMIDAFRPDNGATQFVPASHCWPTTQDGTPLHRRPEAGERVLACGAAGSVLVFHGSVWHGHSANASTEPRRSLQGAYIPRTGHAATGFRTRMTGETLARLGSVEREVLAL